jgi:EmrB/QacA subfamily drug resistance transporter
VTTSPTVRKWVVFGAVAPGVFMTLLDEFGLNQAVPAISDHFNATIPDVQWVVLGFLLATGALLLPVGRLADILGHRRIYLLGIIIFTAGALLAGSTPTLSALIGFKVLQGVGAAMVQATVVPIITGAFPTSERGKALGMFMGVLALGAIAGPVLGGAAVTLLGWRAMLYLAAPVGAISIVLAVRVLGITEPHNNQQEDEKSGSEKSRSSFDWAGAALSTVILVLFLLTVSNGNSLGWTSGVVIGGFVAVVTLVVAFVAWELRAPEPMLPLEMFRNPTFVIGQAVMFLIVLGNSGIFFLLPFYLQEVVGLTPVLSGLVVSGVPIAFLSTGPLAGYMSDRISWRFFLPIGSALALGSMAMLTRLTVDSPIWWSVLTMLIMGFGIGFIFSPAQNAIYGVVKPDGQGVVTAFINMARNTATLSSVAVGTAIVTATMGGLGFEPSLDAVKAVTEVGDAGINAAFLQGMTRAFVIGAIVVAIGLAVTLIPIRASRSP